MGGKICKSPAPKNKGKDKRSPDQKTKKHFTWKDVPILGHIPLPHEIVLAVGEKIHDDLQACERQVMKFARNYLDEGCLSETCIPGVFVHNGPHESFQSIWSAKFLHEIPIVLQTQKVSSAVEKLENDPRTADVFKKIAGIAGKSLGIPADQSFESFPSALNAQQMCVLAKSCPFVTSGMSWEDDHYTFNCTPSSKNELTAFLFTAMPEKMACSKMVFENDFSDCYLVVNGKEIRYSSENPEEWDKGLMIFVTNLMWYFELLHAALHVYQYVMVSAADKATFTLPFEMFVEEQYADSILSKYLEVSLLLLTGDKDGAVCGKFWPVDTKIAMEGALKIFKLYAKQRNCNEFFNNVFCAGNPKIYENKEILAQCRQYLPLWQNMAVDVCSKVSDEDNKIANEALQGYLQWTDGIENTEGYFKMDTFREWIECQTMLGMLHTHTLNMSRLIYTRYMKSDGLWDDTEVLGQCGEIQGLVAGTLQGLSEDHAIAQATRLKGTRWFDMMQGYQDKREGIAKEFWNSLSEKEIQDNGWCLSVWGPNMFNQTQFTVATYV